MTKLQYSKTGQRHAQNAAKTLHIDKGLLVSELTTS